MTKKQLQISGWFIFGYNILVIIAGFVISFYYATRGWIAMPSVMVFVCFVLVYSTVRHYKSVRELEDWDE